MRGKILKLTLWETAGRVLSASAASVWGSLRGALPTGDLL